MCLQRHIGLISIEYVWSHYWDAQKYGGFQDIIIYDDLKKNPEDRKLPCTNVLEMKQQKFGKRFAQMADRPQY